MNAANRLDLDYSKEALSFQKFSFPIVDVHTHINGKQAAVLYKKAAEQYGVGLTYSMTRVEEMDDVKAVLGEKIRFIATPDFGSKDYVHAHGKGYGERLRELDKKGVKIAKFFSAPRLSLLGEELGNRKLFWINSPNRLEAMDVAAELGMVFMTHVGDPDTWFKSKYKDTTVYGTKREQYEQLEEALLRYPNPWIGAHMGGWPEDLDFLSRLLDDHQNLYLDTSATKWMVRELSKHPREKFVTFLQRFSTRILFGSDIVTTDTHLVKRDSKSEFENKASNREEAFDLYASRYFALRKLFETDVEMESPIADPDLNMVEPERFSELDAPMLCGKSIPDDLLEAIYFRNADRFLEPYYR